MKTEILLPHLGENINEAEVVRLIVKVGDAIKKGDSIAELETGKAVLELPSEEEGTVAEIKIKVGDKVKVGEVMMVLDQAGQKSEKKSDVPDKSASSDKPAESPRSSPAAPGARRLAREKGVEIEKIKGSGPRGMVLAEDVKKIAGAPPLPNPPPKGGGEHSLSMSGIRRQTAINMSRSWNEIPHVTQFDWADITDLDKIRQTFQKRAEDQGGKLTLTVIALKVVASALKVFPKFNSSLDLKNEKIIQHQEVNIGIAVDTEKGLLVPVIREADKKNILKLSVELSGLADKARKRSLTLGEMERGHFSITNLGGLGGTIHFTPLINPPQVAVLGMGKAVMTPVWIDNAWEPRKLLPLSLSYDHRLIDGADAARFLKWIGEALGQPFLMDLEG